MMPVYRVGAAPSRQTDITSAADTMFQASTPAAIISSVSAKWVVSKISCPDGLVHDGIIAVGSLDYNAGSPFAA
jgi:hypothetical protein